MVWGGESKESVCTHVLIFAAGGRSFLPAALPHAAAPMYMRVPKNTGIHSLKYESDFIDRPWERHGGVRQAGKRRGGKERRGRGRREEWNGRVGKVHGGGRHEV